MVDLNLNYNEQKYLCLCGTVHVIVGADIIGLIGLIIGLVLFVYSMIRSSGLAFISATIYLIVFNCLAYAEEKREPFLYLPFLIAQGIVLVAQYVIEVMLIVYWLRLLFGFPDTNFPGTHRYTKIFFVDSGIIAALAELNPLEVSFILFAATMVLVFSQWIYWVVWRACEFMRREVANPVPRIPACMCLSYCLKSLPWHWKSEY